MVLKLLVIDDDELFLKSVARRLKVGRLGDRIEISLANSGEKGLKMLAASAYDLVISDLLMPLIDGKEVLAQSREIRPGTEVIIMTGSDDIHDAIECLRNGAHDYCTKPLDYEELELRIERLIGDLARRNELDSLKAEMQMLKNPGWELRLPSPGMLAVRRSIDAIKGSEFPVLILGESGTGKEVVADAIHRSSSRSEGPHVKVNCAGLVSSLLESEMFGHEKGAFTGAVSAKIGKFELADGGTLFLDEIGDLEIGLQAKLLRVLQDGSYERVGGTKTRQANVRIIAATNHDLASEVRSGSFREDLFYRLNVIRIDLPPLRERIADVPVLAMRFLDAFSRRYSKKVEGFSREAIELLDAYSYPGNVRELENAVARAYTMAQTVQIQPSDLPEEIRKAFSATAAVAASSAVAPSGETVPRSNWDLYAFLAIHEEKHIRGVLAAAGGNRSLAAEWLGISRRQFYNKLERHHIGKET